MGHCQDNGSGSGGEARWLEGLNTLSLSHTHTHSDEKLKWRRNLPFRTCCDKHWIIGTYIGTEMYVQHKHAVFSCKKRPVNYYYNDAAKLNKHP